MLGRYRGQAMSANEQRLSFGKAAAHYDSIRPTYPAEALDWLLGAELLRRSALPLSGFYPLATLALCVLAFSTASLLHTSGFVAVYLCGLVLGSVTHHVLHLGHIPVLVVR